MRRIFSVAVLFFIFISCEDQVTFSNPAVQALKDNILWKATLMNAVQAPDGSLTITAYQKNEILTLKTVSSAVDTYSLGVKQINYATLEQKTGDVKTVFSTGVEDVDGQIVITETDLVNHTVTGNFKFKASPVSVNVSEVKPVIFKEGVFYKVPLTITTK